jgi:mono/diheme cytochrome c family protein
MEADAVRTKLLAWYPVVMACWVCAIPCAAAAPQAVIDARHRELLQAHCQRCHGADAQESGVRVDDLPLTVDTIAAAERWQKVLNVLNSGEMPPKDELQPDRAAKADFLDDLATAMVTARKALADQGGRIAMRRLNRREYKNTLHDLLGVQIDGSDLPADTSPLAFDTVGASLFMTASQFEQYEAIGRDALAAAFKKHLSAIATKTQLQVEAEKTLALFKKANEKLQANQQAAREWFVKLDAAVASPENAEFVAKTRPTLKDEKEFRFHWRSLVGLPAPDDAIPNSGNNPQFLTVILEEKRFIPYEERYLSMPGLDTGAYLAVPSGPRAPNSNSKLNFDIPPDWPPGEYVIRIRCAARPEAPAERRFIEFGHRHYGDRMPAISAHHVTGTMEAPQVIEIPYTLKAASSDPAKRRFMIREIDTGSGVAARRIFDEGLKANGIGPELAIWVDWIEVERKTVSDSDMAPGIRALQPLLDAKDPDIVPASEAKRAVENFIAAAYRGVPPADGEVERLADIYAARRALGAKHQDAIIETLVAVLSSPRFLYRAEPGPDDGRRELSGLEVATRLSYFLWGTAPDAELHRLAKSGALLEPAVLETQTNRLLDDPRSAGFVEPFVAQWLAMDRLDFFQFDLSLYPKFDDSTKEAARREVYETFAFLLRDNGPLSDLLVAEYVVVNGLLADYYGLEGVLGDEFRQVALPAGSPRGGLLGMAAIHAMGSNGEHTSPVERGAWVLRKLLNDPPAPAPPNVPQLARLAGKSLTTRERVVLHQEEPQCASCHRKIDPIGFGLENFDAVGAWRTTDSSVAVNAAGKPDPKTKKTWTIDPSGALHGGPAFADFFELRGIVAARPEQFARGFTAALIQYALGRPCGFGDEPLIDSIVNDARSHGFGTRSFIHALVQSQSFRTK